MRRQAGELRIVELDSKAKVRALARCEELLAALAARADTHLVFTMANTDASGREINAHLRDFVARWRAER